MSRNTDAKAQILLWIQGNVPLGIPVSIRDLYAKAREDGLNVGYSTLGALLRSLCRATALATASPWGVVQQSKGVFVVFRVPAGEVALLGSGRGGAADVSLVTLSLQLGAIQKQLNALEERLAKE